MLGGCLDKVDSVDDGSGRTGAINPSNSSPSIWGAPPTSSGIGQMYSFVPSASDPDGDALTFSVQNKPSWADFDSSSGKISGIPTMGDMGVYSSISISVSDGTDSASLPRFDVSVDQAGSAPNSRPSISGTPPSSVRAGETYSFTPESSDPDGDNLTFSIQNNPSWANFDTSTGTISGTPSSGDVGVYADISISVSDGTDSASLPQFDITVDQIGTGSATLSWTAPTKNEDGTPLTDLASFKVYYGTSSRSYTVEIPVDLGTTTLVVDNLTPDTYYFAATAINSSDIESRFSSEAIKIVN